MSFCSFSGGRIMGACKKSMVSVGARTTAAVIVLCLAAFIPGCSESSAYNPALSDLGGVYASSFEDLDLAVEISGRLSEEDAETDALYAQENWGTSDIYAEVPQSGQGRESDTTGDPEGSAVYADGGTGGKLLRWGISRRPDNMPPKADPGAPELLEKYGGAWIGDTGKSVIYLTFDEGYENGYTPLILDTLAKHNVKAVFFITGPYLKEHQDLVRRMVEEGHIVGNHTVHHPSLPTLDDRQAEEEILGLERAFREKFGKGMEFLRPPKGEYSERTLRLANDLGYCTLFWSFAYDDWYRDKVRGPQYAYDIVMRNLHNGAVLLLHAVSKDNAHALDSIIKGAAERGYSFGDPRDLLPQGKAGDATYGEE